MQEGTGGQASGLAVEASEGASPLCILLLTAQLSLLLRSELGKREEKRV